MGAAAPFLLTLRVGIELSAPFGRLRTASGERWGLIEFSATECHFVPWQEDRGKRAEALWSN